MSSVVCFKSSGRLGVTCADNPFGPGVVVTELIPGSVAAAAGLNTADVITAVNSSPVDTHMACIDAIDRAADRVEFMLLRPTRRVSVRKSEGRIGITCSTSRSLCDNGVVVSALEDHSIALQAGLLVGDTVLAINGCVVQGAQNAVDLIDSDADVVEFIVPAVTAEVTLQKTVGTLMGITVANRSDGACGVVVVGLEPTGAAIRHFQLGDVILSINGRLITSHKHAIERMDASNGLCRMTVGEPVKDFLEVSRSVSRSEASKTSDPRRSPDDTAQWFGLGPSDCAGPVFNRHNDSPLAPSNRRW